MNHYRITITEKYQLINHLMDWLTNISGEHLADYLIIAGGGQSLAPADSGVLSVTACSGQSVSLTCQGRGEISLVRAVWGRFSLAICNSGVRGDFIHMLKSTTCGDTVTPLNILSIQCQGQTQCQVNADNTVFGDPCPGVQEFLEVQYECLEPPKLERPEFADKKIANLWADEKNINIEQIILEELSVSNDHQNRIPITEPNFPEAVGRRGEADFSWRLRSEETRLVWIVGTACILMLPLILLLTVMILKTNNKKKTTCHIQHLAKPNMMFCRLESGAGSITRKFSSEPSLVAHNCLLDSSTSLLRYS